MIEVFIKICKMLITTSGSLRIAGRQIYIYSDLRPAGLIVRIGPHLDVGEAHFPSAYFSSRTLHRPPAHSTAAGMLIKSRPRERYVYVSIRRIYWAVSVACSEHCWEKESISRFMPIYGDFHRLAVLCAGFLSPLYFLPSRKTSRTATKLRGENICPTTT